jgi:hypothetical protein
MIEVKEGTRLRNNDYRKKKGREYQIVTVTAVDDFHAWYHNGEKRCKIALSRIFQPHTLTARGYNIVEAE